MDGNRSSRRSEVRLSCPCRLSDGITLDLELLDVSPRGCRVRVDALPLHFGQSLTIFPEGIDPFTGTVRRADDEFAGIEFDNELPHPVYERIRSHAPSDDDAQVAQAAQAAPAEPTPPAPQSENGAESEAEDAEITASQRPGFGSLTSIRLARRRQPSFGNKTVVLP